MFSRATAWPGNPRVTDPFLAPSSRGQGCVPLPFHEVAAEHPHSPAPMCNRVLSDIVGEHFKIFALVTENCEWPTRLALITAGTGLTTPAENVVNQPATSLKRKRVWLPVFLENISLWLTISIVKESARSDPSFGSALSEGFCDFNQYIVL